MSRTQEVKVLHYLKEQNNGNKCQPGVIHEAEEAPSGEAIAPAWLYPFYKTASPQGQNQ